MPESRAFSRRSVAAGFPPGIPGEVLTALSARFLDEATCDKWFFGRYYPLGPCCPECQKPISSEKSLHNFRLFRRFTCPECGAQPNAKNGTVLQNSSLMPRDLVLLAVTCGWGIDHREIARVVGIAPETVRAWRDKFAALAEVGH